MREKLFLKEYTNLKQCSWHDSLISYEITLDQSVNLDDLPTWDLIRILGGKINEERI